MVSQDVAKKNQHTLSFIVKMFFKVLFVAAVLITLVAASPTPGIANSRNPGSLHRRQPFSALIQ